MDVYGLNPKMNKKMSEFPTMEKMNKLEEKGKWKEKWEILDNDRELTEKYWKEKDEYERINKGAYFRNNCWYWRPLWMYVCKVCNLSTDAYQQGNRNEGYKVDEATAKDIAVTLFLLLERGDVDRYAKEYSKSAVKCGGSPEYPFDVENVRNFAVFCDESGGFEIS